MHNESIAPAFHARVLDASGTAIGTCWLAAPGVVISAEHVVRLACRRGLDIAPDVADLPNTVTLQPFEPGPPVTAEVVGHDTLADLVIMTINPNDWNVAPAQLGDSTSVSPAEKVLISGHADLPEIEGEGAPIRLWQALGTWTGRVAREDSSVLGRVESKSVLLGMSGAPVLSLRHDEVVGTLSGRYNSEDGWARDSVWVSTMEDLAKLWRRTLGNCPIRNNPPEVSRSERIFGADHHLSQTVNSSQDARRHRRMVREQYAISHFEGRTTELVAVTAALRDGMKALWWQGDAWAGKTTLMARIADQPPENVAVVSFFVRFGVADTRAAFLRETLPQLAELAGYSEVSFGFDETARIGQLIDLLEEAAATQNSLGKTLVFLIDGLDEDVAFTDTRDATPSILSCLPAAAPLGCLFILASRPQPGIPMDIRTNPRHYLNQAEVIRELLPSAAALAARDVAFRDVQSLLDDTVYDGLPRRLACVLAAAQAPLSLRDFADLMGEEVGRLSSVLYHRHGRLFRRLEGTQRQPSFRFAHRSIEEVMLENLGGHSNSGEHAAGNLARMRLLTLAAWRKVIFDRAQHWQTKAWPPEAPDYFFTSAFCTMLLLDPDRLQTGVEIFSDRRWVKESVARAGSPFVALNSQREVASRLASGDVSANELRGIAKLAWGYEETVAQAGQIPPALPAALALATGEFRPARNLIDLMESHSDRWSAWVHLVVACFHSGHMEEMQAASDYLVSEARILSDPAERAHCLSVCSFWNDVLGRPSEARSLAHDSMSCTSSSWSHADRVTIERGIAERIAQGGYLEPLLKVLERTDQQVREEDVRVVIRHMGGRHPAAISVLEEWVRHPYSLAALRLEAAILANDAVRTKLLDAGLAAMAYVDSPPHLHDLLCLAAMACHADGREDDSRSYLELSEAGLANLAHPTTRDTACFSLARARLYTGDPTGALDLLAKVRHPEKAPIRSVSWILGQETLKGKQLTAYADWLHGEVARLEITQQDSGDLSRIALVIAILGRTQSATDLANRILSAVGVALPPAYTLTRLGALAPDLTGIDERLVDSLIARLPSTVERDDVRRLVTLRHYVSGRQDLVEDDEANFENAHARQEIRAELRQLQRQEEERLERARERALRNDTGQGRVEPPRRTGPASSNGAPRLNGSRDAFASVIEKEGLDRAVAALMIELTNHDNDRAFIDYCVGAACAVAAPKFDRALAALGGALLDVGLLGPATNVLNSVQNARVARSAMMGGVARMRATHREGRMPPEEANGQYAPLVARLSVESMRFQDCWPDLVQIAPDTAVALAEELLASVDFE